MSATTFLAIDPTTGSTFGDPIAEMSKETVQGLISKAAKQKSALAQSSPAKRAELLRAIAAAVESKREKLKIGRAHV